MEERGSAYFISEKGIQIHNPWGLAEFQKKYPIFKDQTILDLIEFVNKTNLHYLTKSEYMDIIKEITGRFESVFRDISDIKSAIDWTLVPDVWAEKELSVWQGSSILKSVFIQTHILHKGKSYGL